MRNVAACAGERQVFFERFVVGVLFVVFTGDDDGLWIGEARQIVNVPVRVVAGDAVLQPDCLRRAQILTKDGFDIGASQFWIAGLDRAQQAFFGSQNGARAIHINAAAFENNAMAVAIRA